MAPATSPYGDRPAVLLAPMEDVSDPPFRKVCRTLGASLCFTEFVNVDSLLKGDVRSQRKLRLAPDDHPTAIQIYGADPRTLREAAILAEQAGAAFIDINCGCWVPRIAGRGAGAAWLREPDRMVEMAALIVQSVRLPVTVKTRIGWGLEEQMPIVDLARRLEDVGVSGITVHCRTAKMRHDGAADWSWAARTQAAVRIPVICNGDIRTAEDCRRALAQTGCAGVMIGRGVISYPWVFREARALLQRGEVVAPPTVDERLAFLITLLKENVAWRGPDGVFCTRRHYAGMLGPIPGGEALKAKLYATKSWERALELLEEARARPDVLPPERAVA
ncbi:MAG: tRNA-dihydrouridine synthase family protein [Myxococcaceae bacterium]|nr:tRNA-dihydrouridine synthase family protein [Myxococcaceae bacterium]